MNALNVMNARTLIDQRLSNTTKEFAYFTKHTFLVQLLWRQQQWLLEVRDRILWFVDKVHSVNPVAWM